MSMKKTLVIILVILIFSGGGLLFLRRQGEKKQAELEKSSRTEKKETEEIKDQSSVFEPRTIVAPNQLKAEKNSSIYLKTDKSSDSEDKEEYGVGESFNLQVWVNAQEEVVDGAEFLLNYDPNLVEIGKLIPGAFFSLYPQKKVDKDKGTIKVIALQAPDESKKLGQEILMTIPINPKEKGTVSFSFDKIETNIAAYGGQELLKETFSLTVLIR